MKKLLVFFYMSLSFVNLFGNNNYPTAASSEALGVIYTKNSWSNTTDFITNGNSTATLNGNFINISSSTTYNWNNTIYITDYHTKLEKWKFKLRFKIITWAANSYGIGFGLKSANQYVQNDVMGFIQTTNTGIGGLYILQSNQNILATGSSPIGVALNDIIELEGIFYDSIFTFNASNITSGSSKTIAYTFASNGSTPVIPNTSHFALLELGGTHQLQNIEITSDEIAHANIVTIGDSKTTGYFTNTFSGRYAAQLNISYAPAIINAGGGDRVTHVLLRQAELEKLNANKYLLCIGSNDLRFGGTLAELQTNYNTLVSTLQATGATVYHTLIPEDYTKSGTVNQTAFKNWLASAYSTFYINGVWDSLSSGGILKSEYDSGDGIHLTQSANNKIYQALVASGKLASIILPAKLNSFTVKKVNIETVAISWSVDPFQQAEKYTLLKSRDGIDFYEIAERSSKADGLYNYVDKISNAGNYYYKLRMTEAGGFISFSSIAVVKNSSPGIKLTGFRSINNNEVNFKLSLSEPLNIRWKVINQTGATLQSCSVYMQEGNNEISAKITAVNAIFYLVVYSDKKSNTLVFPFIKQ